MSKKVFCLFIGLAVVMAFAASAFANVPPPPANQKIGIPDSVFDSLQEDDCRFCHDNPAIVPPPSNVNRHHLRYGQPLEEGNCSATDAVCNFDDDCNPNVCSLSATTPCTDDNDCVGLGSCGEMCVGGSVAPLPPAPDGTYQCTTCHPITTNGTISIIAVRDCLVCHTDSPHHTTTEAQSQDCQFCHGDVINNPGDGHIIPTYDPSLVTPNPGGGNGQPLNVEGTGAGGCRYCHSTGTGQPGAVQPGIVSDPAFLGPFGGPVAVYRNDELHHGTGLGLLDDNQCLWCHNIDDPASDPIRRCEQCHGFESLHNIAVDSNGDGFNPAGSPNEENPGWSHVGHNDDCWGCHGFAAASASAAPATGPIVPQIDGADITNAPAGQDTQITLTGTNLQNTMGDTTWTCNVSLTDSIGNVVEVTPDFVSADSLTFTVSSAMAPGNYDVRCVKGDKISNQIPLTLYPDAVITNMSCDSKRVLTITGQYFGDRPAGAEEHIKVDVDGVTATVRSWTENQVQVYVPDCRVGFTAVVETLFDSESKLCSKGCKNQRSRRQ